MKKAIHVILLLIILSAVFSPPMAVDASIKTQGFNYLDQAARILQQMSVEERVGEVFLVSFTGNSINEDSQVLDLVEEKHVGGVLLRRDNDNFIGPDNTAATLQEMIIRLQRAKKDTALANDRSLAYTPLLIGIRQEGDLYPGDQLLNGITVLPNAMTIGATWDTNNALVAGSILGADLSALGINLLLGPSLDVLDVIRKDGGDDLGATTFGGNPYWVGEMGQAFIEGVHKGSRNRIAVIATHFPGIGSSDRKPEEEIATVRKSLDQLKNNELAPFFKVTDLEQEQAQLVDGLLVSHTRYQGFQGNILTSTKPVSLDSNALELIMQLPQLNPWRESGGVIISDDLGSDAIKKFVDPLGTGYDARQVARTALMAGNDMLYLGNIIASGDQDSYTTVVRTIDYFVQKYQEDSAFRVRVDQAALNIIALKLKLYPSFDEGSIVPDQARLDTLGQRQEEASDILQNAVTLISPSFEDLSSVLPSPPEYSDRIVIISDTLTFAQCSSCDTQTIFPAESILSALIRLYGSGAGDPIQSTNLNAFSYERLRLLLEQAEGTEEVQVMLNSATWVIFAFTDFGTDKLDTTVFRRLFNERPDLVRNKKIVGMAFGEPYYLDATDISKFTAYYSLFNKLPESYDLAARVLLQELIPTGNLPVSMPGTGYELSTQTSPEPSQIIPLVIEAPAEMATPVSTPPTGYSQPLLYKAGDTIPVKAGQIVDHNGNPVPDGTRVNFVIDTMSTSGSVEQLEAETVDGYARVMYVIPSIGSLELRVTADPALTSQILRLDITDAGGVVTSFEPTIAVTEEIEPTATQIPPTPTPLSPIEQRHVEGKGGLIDWLLSNLFIWGFCFLFSWLAHRHLSRKWNYVTILAMGIGGYLAYFYLALGLPGTLDPINTRGTTFFLISVTIGMVVGLAVSLIFYWQWRTRGNSSKQGDKQR